MEMFAAENFAKWEMASDGTRSPGARRLANCEEAIGAKTPQSGMQSDEHVAKCEEARGGDRTRRARLAFPTQSINPIGSASPGSFRGFKLASTTHMGVND